MGKLAFHSGIWPRRQASRGFRHVVPTPQNAPELVLFRSQGTRQPELHRLPMKGALRWHCAFRLCCLPSLWRLPPSATRRAARPVLQRRLLGLVPGPFGCQVRPSTAAIEATVYASTARSRAPDWRRSSTIRSGTISSHGQLRRGMHQPRRFRADYVDGARPRMSISAFRRAARHTTVNVAAAQKRGKTGCRSGQATSRRDRSDAAAWSRRRPRQGLRPDGQDLRWRDARRPEADPASRHRSRCRLPGRHGHLPAGLQAGGWLPQGHKALEFLRPRRIMVTFAPLGKTGVYAPDPRHRQHPDRHHHDQCGAFRAIS